VREMLQPGVEIESMFKNVRVKVLHDTNKRQMPWVNSSLTIDFRFNPGEPSGGGEPSRQAELKRLQTMLDRREQQQRELEAQLAAMQHELERKRSDATVAPGVGATPGPAEPRAKAPAPTAPPPAAEKSAAPAPVQAKSPAATAETSRVAAGAPTLPSGTAAEAVRLPPAEARKDEPGKPERELRARRDSPAEKPPATDAPKPPISSAGLEKPASGKRTESERCVALQIRAQLGEPVSTDDLQRECKK